MPQIGYNIKIFSNKHSKKIFIKWPGIEHAKDKVNPLLSRTVPVQKTEYFFLKIMWLFFHPLHHRVELFIFYNQ